MPMSGPLSACACVQRAVPDSRWSRCCDERRRYRLLRPLRRTSGKPTRRMSRMRAAPREDHTQWWPWGLLPGGGQVHVGVALNADGPQDVELVGHWVIVADAHV